MTAELQFGKTNQIISTQNTHSPHVIIFRFSATYTSWGYHYLILITVRLAWESSHFKIFFTMSVFQ